MASSDRNPSVPDSRQGTHTGHEVSPFAASTHSACVSVAAMQHLTCRRGESAISDRDPSMAGSRQGTHTGHELSPFAWLAAGSR